MTDLEFWTKRQSKLAQKVAAIPRNKIMREKEKATVDAFNMVNWILCHIFQQHIWHRQYAWGVGGYPIWQCVHCRIEKERIPNG